MIDEKVIGAFYNSQHSSLNCIFGIYAKFSLSNFLKVEKDFLSHSTSGVGTFMDTPKIAKRVFKFGNK